ncbi:MAG: hypothetical protein GXO40_00570 [Epsilonproteobacteria bacterium]|nr:hypothetical protein [Campylobacterota bacterium]
MVAAAFFYYNFKFAQFKFIDFSNVVMYTNSDIFVPHKDHYYVLVYSSKMNNPQDLIVKLPHKYPILAIDFYGQRHKPLKNVIFLRAGTNALIKIIQKFNIYQVPIYFEIIRYNKNLFKQNSPKEIL